jgi:hypothetical protein
VEQQVLAYLDPGSGSMLIQILVGGLAAVGVTLKLYWRRLTGLFGGKKPREEDTRGPSAEPPASASARDTRV